MNMRVRTSIAAGVLTLVCAGAAVAQSGVDRSFTATSDDCSGIQWSQQALETYPTIASACQGIEVRNGKRYAKFEGTVQRNIENGKQLEVRFKDGGNMMLTPKPDVVVYINDKKTPVKDLSRGDELNFYVPEDRFAAQIAQDTSATPQYVVVPIVYHQTTYEPERTAAALPSTATNDGIMLLFGSLMTALGMWLTFQRRRQER
jgi:LPXTG-motif cell wall-anchored protein